MAKTKPKRASKSTASRDLLALFFTIIPFYFLVRIDKDLENFHHSYRYNLFSKTFFTTSPIDSMKFEGESFH